MPTWRINNSTVLGNYVCAQWAPSTAYALGDRVVCRVAYGTTTARAYVYECTTAGTSHAATEPTWPASGTVADNDIVWTTRNPNDGTWNNASCILHYILNHAAVAAGDTILIDDGHSETPNLGGTSRYTVKGSTTVNNPIKIYCVDKATDGLSVGANVQHSNATYGFYFNGYGYSYGVQYECIGTRIEMGNTDGAWTFEGAGTTSLIKLASGRTLDIGSTHVCRVTILNGSITAGGTGCYINLQSQGYLIWKGGSVICTTGITALIGGSDQKKTAKICDVDLSSVAKTALATSLVSVANAGYNMVDFERCKLSNDANFAIISGAWIGPESGLVRLHHCSSANTTYDFHEESYEGSIRDETTIIRDGGASDGTTPQSWKMISSANTLDNINPLISPPIQSWTESTTEKTFTIECILDSATNLQNDEVWMEFEYPVNATDGLGGFARDKCAILGTPADKTASVVTWNGTGGMTNPNKFKVRVTVTPGKKGPITARVCLAKPSTTIYIDPLITES